MSTFSCSEHCRSYRLICSTLVMCTVCPQFLHIPLRNTVIYHSDDPDKHAGTEPRLCKTVYLLWFVNYSSTVSSQGYQDCLEEHILLPHDQLHMYIHHLQDGIGFKLMPITNNMYLSICRRHAQKKDIADIEHSYHRTFWRREFVISE